MEELILIKQLQLQMKKIWHSQIHWNLNNSVIPTHQPLEGVLLEKQISEPTKKKKKIKKRIYPPIIFNGQCKEFKEVNGNSLYLKLNYFKCI